MDVYIAIIKCDGRRCDGHESCDDVETYLDSKPRDGLVDFCDYQIALVDARMSLPFAAAPGWHGSGQSEETQNIGDLNEPTSSTGLHGRKMLSANTLPQSQKRTASPHQYRKVLPHCRLICGDQDPCELALQFASHLIAKDGCGLKPSRAVPVPLLIVNSQLNHTITKPNNIASCSTAACYCIPLHASDDCEKFATSSRSRLQFYCFGQLLKWCRSASAIIDVDACHHLLRLEEWFFKHSARLNFVKHLFVRDVADTRLHCCVHNPGFKDEIKSCCHRTQSYLAQIYDDSELRSEARQANAALTRMMALEKCDLLVMNPLFGSGLPYRIGHEHQLTIYFAKDRPDPLVLEPSQLTNNSDGSDSSISCMDEYPLHKYAYLGNSEGLRHLLQQGYDSNQLDADSWAPIHYACWYGHLTACQILLNFGSCNVNICNRNNSTPLHFAVWCGHRYLVELLLSHPDLNLNVRDKDGKLPLELCECVPKPEWQAICQLLRSAQKERLPKIQIDLMDGSNVMVGLIDGVNTSAEQICGFIASELGIKYQALQCFALWICSDSLQLQLKTDHKPVKHLNAWKNQILPKLSDSPNPSIEDPRLVFRRNAHSSVARESKIQLGDVCIALLFHESREIYCQGLYPCSDQDAALMAATCLQIIHGDCRSDDAKRLLANAKMLSKLLPQQKLKNKKINWVQRIISEHKHVQKNISDLQFQFLSFCRNLIVYGSAFFDAIIFMNKPAKGALQVHVGINDVGLHLINYDTKAMIHSYVHKELEFSYVHEMPYIEFKIKSSPAYSFRLRTRQASLINTLLKKLNQGHKDVKSLNGSSSPSF